jgi:hypothetical protein
MSDAELIQAMAEMVPDRVAALEDTDDPVQREDAPYAQGDRVNAAL